MPKAGMKTSQNPELGMMETDSSVRSKMADPKKRGRLKPFLST